MTAPLFSAVMNVCDGAPWLAEAIASVLAQEGADFELLIVDDASVDGTAAICARIDDPRARYLRLDERVPLGVARHLACVAARGHWLAFLDQDDVWLPGKLARQAAVIAAAEADGKGDVALVYGRTQRFDAAGPRGEFDPWHGIGRQPDGDIFRALLRRPSFVALSSACLRADAVRVLGPIPAWVRLCPDYWLFVQLAKRWRAACVQVPVCRYRLHAASMSATRAGAIHREAAAIAADAARPADAALAAARARAAETLVAWYEMRGSRAFAHVLRRGSPAFLAGHLAMTHGWRPLLRRWGMR